MPDESVPEAGEDPSVEVEKIFNAIITSALMLGASDIHLDPFEDPAGKVSRVLLRYRIDGVLTPGPFNPLWQYRSHLMAKIKVMSNMDITERRVPQTGRIELLFQGKPVRLYAQTMPVLGGEACVLRVLENTGSGLALGDLGFLPDTRERFLGLLRNVGRKRNSGVILVCGPADSGRTTTLYAALSHLNRPDLKVITAECPVERGIEGIVQIPVDPGREAGQGAVFDYATAVRHSLRFDPDVVMVAEIGDSGCAGLILRTAVTGRLVFSTVYVPEAAAALARLLDMGLPALTVATAVKAVLAQRLVRRLCQACKTSHEASPEDARVFQELGVELPAGAQLFEPPQGGGCRVCGMTGFKGRLGLQELLVLDDDMRSVLLRGATTQALREAARKKGMRLLLQDGLEKVKLGQTSMLEIRSLREESGDCDIIS
jgi:type II secretory ATPase GspE/PulE/Tfp pilus assembly ATPase PilB-like protein